MKTSHHIWGLFQIKRIKRLVLECLYRLQKLTQNVQVNSLALLADCQSFVGRLLVDSQPTDGQQIFLGAAWY